MTAFRSAGTPSIVFNAPVQPGAPAGVQPGDILVVGFIEHAGSDAPPDLSAFGFTLKSSAATQIGLYTKTATGSDTMPSAQFGADWCGAFCLAYSGCTEVADRASNSRSANLTSGIAFPSATAPPSNNVTAIGLGMRNSGVLGVSFSNYMGMTQRATIINVGGQDFSAVIEDLIMTTPVAFALGVQGSTPTDASALTNAATLIFLQSISAAVTPPGNNYFPDVTQGKKLHASQQQFWSVPLSISIIPPAAGPPPTAVDLPVPRGRPPLPPDLRSINQNLLESTLFGQDRVLTPCSWDYEWDKPTLGVQFMESSPLTVAELTALTTYAPYIEYNWPVPPGVRQTQKGYEFSFPLELIGKDVITAGGIQNNMWDPPRAPKRPVENLTWVSSGLALFYSVPIKPPQSQMDWPNPLRARQPVNDLSEGLSAEILGLLSTFPPFQPSQASPPAGPRWPKEIGFVFSTLALLKGQDQLPVSGRISGMDDRRASLPFRDIFTIAESSIFLVPSGPPVPPIVGSGVVHVGRLVLDPGRVGETINLPFDFQSGLAQGEVLTSANAVVATYSGIDNAPQSMVSSVTVSGTKAFVQVTPQFVGVIYSILVTASTSSAQVLKISAYFAVEPTVP